MLNVIKKNVDKGLCSGCGVCVGSCPAGALSMEFGENGDLVPTLDIARCRDNCRICLSVCPFSTGIHNPRKKNIELFRDPGGKYDENIGWYKHTIAGYRNDERLREKSASGGLVTYCLESLLKRKWITRVAVVRFAANAAHGFFEFYSASTVGELRRSSGSIYHPVEISGIIQEIKADNTERWAIVGVPCLCAGIRNNRQLNRKVPYVFGLACGMYQNVYYTEMLLTESGVNPVNVKNIEYRVKSDQWPLYDYRFRGTDDEGAGKDIAYRGLPFYLGKNAFFRLNACNFCMDVFAETADACFMDAWLPEYRSDLKGTSLAVLRKEELFSLLSMGKNVGEVHCHEISPEEVIYSQRGHVRRKRSLILMRNPHMNIDGPGVKEKATIYEKLSWKLQRYTQKKSKKAWKKFGRKNQRSLFWLALSDILMMQYAMKFLLKVESIYIRMRRRILRLTKRLSQRKATHPRNPKILLIGIGGVYNYGCEAIIRGTEEIIRQVIPEANIVYASVRVTDDQKRLSDSRTRVIERGQIKRYSLNNIFRKLCSFAGVRWFPSMASPALLKGIDAVLSIGGDIYTLRPNNEMPLALPKFGEAARKKRIPYILWGASIGPFSENVKIENIMRRHLEKLPMISARETATIDYLKSLGITENVVSCADPAFAAVNGAKFAASTENHGQVTIGINLSPLSVLYHDKAGHEIMVEQARSIESLIEAFGASVLLIPHVFCDFKEKDDDLRYLCGIKKIVSKAKQTALAVCERDSGFLGLKKELVKCNIVLAARMHCAINALSSCVPTIFISYSRKAYGMSDYVYGNGEWVLPLEDFSTNGALKEKVRLLLENEGKIRNYLSKRIIEIRKDSFQPAHQLKNLIYDT